MNLAKNSKKVICVVYKMFLDSRKKGISIDSSKLFELDFYKEDKNLSNWAEGDITSCLEELEDNDYITTYGDMSFELHDNAIVEMENRFKNGVIDVVDFIAKLS